ncbi:hypothetical protein Tco_0639725 [Tanacetum coccineum]
MSDSSAGVSDLDDIYDMEVIMQQLRYEQSLQEEEAESSNHRNYIYRERDVAEELKGIETYIETVDLFPAHFDFFRVRPDATGQPSFNVIMKCTSAIRQLAYDVTPDALDEYLQMGDHCARDSQLATKGVLGEVVTTCERSQVRVSPWGFSFKVRIWGFCPIDASIRGWQGLPSGYVL